MPVDPRVVRGVIGKAKVVLTDTQFKYFQLFYEDEWTIDEIAVAYDVSESAVYRTLKRAKSTMKVEWR